MELMHGSPADLTEKILPALKVTPVLVKLPKELPD